MQTQTVFQEDPKWPTPAGKTYYTGYMLHGGERVEVEFTAHAGASKESLDSAFLDALAQQVKLDYICVG